MMTGDARETPRCDWDTEDGPCPNDAFAHVTVELLNPADGLGAIELAGKRPTCMEHGRQLIRVFMED